MGIKNKELDDELKSALSNAKNAMQKLQKI